ncbi:MAG: D-proline reductase (dithiol) PrdB [Ilumatobacter sp.]|jgi:D-proline reductase (dithiol) PrdB
MVRLSDLHAAEAEHLQARADAMQMIEPGVWIAPKPLAESTVAIVSTAGLHLRSDAPFTLGALDYRVVPSDADWGDVAMSHVSTNFDRSAFQQDPNISFPAERLREMADAGEIGGVSKWHYSFMGAMPAPQLFEDTGTEVGRLLAADGVDVALLVPV